MSGKLTLAAINAFLKGSGVFLVQNQGSCFTIIKESTTPGPVSEAFDQDHKDAMVVIAPMLKELDQKLWDAECAYSKFGGAPKRENYAHLRDYKNDLEKFKTICENLTLARGDMSAAIEKEKAEYFRNPEAAKHWSDDDPEECGYCGTVHEQDADCVYEVECGSATPEQVAHLHESHNLNQEIL